MINAFLRRLGAVLGVLFLLGGGVAAQTGSAAVNRLVVQVSDGEAPRWNMVLNNIRNVQSELGAGMVDVVLVAYGPGIGMLKAEATTANRITELLKSGVKVVACENTLTSLKIAKDEMHPGIGYVPAGAVEIMRRQQQGFAYLRP